MRIQLDDIQLMVVYGDEDLLKSLQEDKLMSQIPAIKNRCSCIG